MSPRARTIAQPPPVPPCSEETQCCVVGSQTFPEAQSVDVPHVVAHSPLVVQTYGAHDFVAPSFDVDVVRSTEQLAPVGLQVPSLHTKLEKQSTMVRHAALQPPPPSSH